MFQMKARYYIPKALFVMLLLLSIQMVYAAFSLTGIADEKAKGKYSLKNLSNLSHKSLSFSTLRSTLQFKGVQQPMMAKETVSGVELSSSLRFDNGSTTYVYPYKFKVKASKFKTPSPQH